MARKSQGANDSTRVSEETKVEGAKAQPTVVSAKTKMGGGTAMGKNVQSAEMDLLLKALKQLQEQVETLKQEKETKVEEVSPVEETDDFDSTQIRQDEYIKVISLTPHTLNLTTKVGGKGGKIFMFPTFGATKRILYSDLVEILENFTHFLEAGLFYIADKRVIRKHGLDDIYTKVLSKDKMEVILDGKNDDTTISLFKSANKRQQDTLIQMLIDKMIAGSEIDLNLIDKLSRASGVKIQEKYEDTKAYVESLNIPGKEPKQES